MRVWINALAGLYLISFVPFWGEVSSFNFSEVPTNPFPPITKQSIQNMKVWRKDLKKPIARRDKKSFLHGHVHDSSLKWDWGFRDGIKYNRTAEDVLIAATYTHYHSKPYASIERQGELLPLWHKDNSLQALELGSSMHSRWRLNVDIADLELGKTLKFKNDIHIHPHAGVRATWMNQRFDINYEEYARGVLKEPDLWNNSFAIGTRGGIDTSWKVNEEVSVFGDSALSFLSAYHNLHSKFLTGSPVVLSRFPSIGMAGFECSLGIQYEKKLENIGQFLTFRVGYEFNYFFNQDKWANWFSPFANNVPLERITMQGLSSGLRLDF